MKIRTLAVAAGVSAPLILAGGSDAGFLGTYVVKKPNVFNLMTLSVYAEFDNPGGDWMQSAAGTPQNPMSITAVGGVFYNNKFGSDQAPSQLLVDAFPSLAYDSFFTIGVKALAPGQINALNLVNMPYLAGHSVNTTNGSWGLVPPTAPQGNPFDSVNSYPGNGSILISQFSMEIPAGDPPELHGIRGTFLIKYVSDGAIGVSYVGFENVVGACTADATCTDGDPCNGEEWCDLDTGECQPAVPEPDCNGNGILDACDIAAGTSTDANGNGRPDDCDVLCPSDLDGDGSVGVTDFLLLLQYWGACPL